MNSSYYKIICAAIFALLLTVTGCAVRQERQGPKDTLFFGISNASATVFHPAYAESECEKIVCGMLYETLLTKSGKDSYMPALAESYELTADGKSVIFKLRENVRWHNGVMFTAADVRYTFESVGSPAYRGKMYAGMYAVRGAEQYKCGEAESINGVEIIDDYTVKISTDELIWPFLDDIGTGMYIVSGFDRDYYSRESEESSNKPIGTGRYVFDCYSVGQTVNLTANSEYWGDKPKVDKIIIEAMSYEESQEKLRQGQLDGILCVTAGDEAFDRLKNDGYSVCETGRITNEQVIFNLSNEYLRSREFRKALMHAVDRAGLVDSFFGHEGNLINTCYPSIHEYYPGDDAISAYPFDTDKAKSMIAMNASFEYADGILYKNGEPVVLRLLYSNSNRFEKMCAPVIQENLSKIGIAVETEFVHHDEILRRMDAGDYDMALFETSNEADADIRDSFHIDSIKYGRNFSGYRNRSLSDIVDKAMLCRDPSERRALFKEAAAIINDDVPCMFIFSKPEIHVFSQELYDMGLR